MYENPKEENHTPLHTCPQPSIFLCKSVTNMLQWFPFGKCFLHECRGHPIIKAGLLLAAIGAGAVAYALQANNKKAADAKVTKKDLPDRK